jgi:hypothetical protein
MDRRLAKRNLVSGPVQYEIRGPIDNPTALKLSINYEEAPVPQHYYVADWFHVDVKDLDVIMRFGNLDAVNHCLRSQIQVVFPAFQLIRQLWKSSREFHAKLSALLESLHLEPLQPETAALAGDKLQVLMANNVLMVHIGTECMMDFFYISPKDLWSKPRRQEALELEPVVRVLLSPTLLVGFLDACRPIVEQLSNQFEHFLSNQEQEA